MEAVKELLYKMADDDLIIGHRNSEWTGLGPIMEEDIAFSSIAQDKVGHAFSLFNILHEQLGEKNPDLIAFARPVKDFKCCHFVELPIGEYDFSLIRHFLFDHADLLRYELLGSSDFLPLAQLSRKIKGEIKYHILHADTWIVQLANGNEESNARMQSALNFAFPFALGIFEECVFEQELIDKKIFAGEKILQSLWLENIAPVLKKANLLLPDLKKTSPVLGGRKGFHTEHLQPLIEEMGEVFRIDPNASW